MKILVACGLLVRALHRRHLLRLMLGNQRVDHVADFAVHNEIELVEREIDAMVRHAALWVVVGTNALASVTRADERFAQPRFFGVRGFAFAFQKT